MCNSTSSSDDIICRSCHRIDKVDTWHLACFIPLLPLVMLFAFNTHTQACMYLKCLINCFYRYKILLLLPHPFPLFCGVDVSYEMPPFYSVFGFLPDTYLLDKSLFMSSNDLRFDPYLLLFHDISIIIPLLPMY